MRRSLALAAAASLLGLAMVPLLTSAGAAAGLDGLVTGEAESYALRIEYDAPLPLGPGTIPHTVGEVRRSQAGENSKGLAAAPTHFAAVVGGTYADPDKSRKGDERLPPQVECFYPGDLVNTAFAFPTNTQAETAPLPPTSRASARCVAGPEVELHASAAIAEIAAVTARDVASDTLIRPAAGVARATTAAHASSVSIANGAVTIGAIQVDGVSTVTGKTGGAASHTRVSLTDVVAGGVTFSLADDRLLAGPLNLPIGGPLAQSVIDQANAGLAASRCRVDVITQPAHYPQGFLFSRPNPRVGVAGDGSFAGSLRAGLLIVCDLPESVTGNTDLNPQRVQVVAGFAYSAVSAVDEPGGFNLGNLIAAPGLPSLSLAPGLNSDSALGPLAPTTELTAGPSTPPPRPAGTVSTARPVRLAASLGSALRWSLGLVCLVVWALLTHFGITRLRKA